MFIPEYIDILTNTDISFSPYALIRFNIPSIKMSKYQAVIAGLLAKFRKASSNIRFDMEAVFCKTCRRRASMQVGAAAHMDGWR